MLIPSMDDTRVLPISGIETLPEGGLEHPASKIIANIQEGRIIVLFISSAFFNASWKRIFGMLFYTS